MKKEAEEHADEDTKKKELIATRNHAEQMIYPAEKALKDHGDKISSEIKDEVTAKITSLNEIKSKDDKDAISTATEALSSAMQKIGEAMSKAPTSAEAGTETTKEGEQVRDAEEVKDEGDTSSK